MFLVGLLMFYLYLSWPDDNLHVYFCDVGQGDSAIITKGSFQAVVDVGDNKEKFDVCWDRAVPFWDREIEVLYISHTDKDHFGILEEVKLSYAIGKLMADSEVGDMVRYGKLKIETIVGAEPRAGGRVLGTNTDNIDSVVLRMVFGDFSALFTGDLDTEGELAMMSGRVLEKTKVLKVGHHGSKTSSSLPFLESLGVKWAVVSVGAKNSYGHPSREVLSRLDTLGVKTLRTDELGTIEIISDGKMMRIK